MDPLSIVVDEVALEGLDGITIPSLWIRLEEKKSKFPLKLDDGTKELIWRSLIHNTDLTLYQLPQERRDVELFDRFKEIDPDTGIETTERFADTRPEVYPVEMVQDNKDGIQGSCVFFKRRIDVTKQVRSKSLTPLLNLQEALERYGRTLVVVASQNLRFRTLIGLECDPEVKLNDDSYCVLERVGRARWQGELQRDLHGCSFKIDARKLHYMRKSLVNHGLISMQSHVARLTTTGQQQHSILLLLKRFHVDRRSKYDVLMEYVSNILQESPDRFATLIMLRDRLNVNERSFKRIFQYMRASKLVEFCLFPLEDLDPSAGPCINKKGKKVMVRCAKLLKPYVRKGVTEDDDEDEEDDGTGARRRDLPLGRVMEKDVLTQAYHCVLSSSTDGISQRAIGVKMNVGKLEARMLCRKMEKEGVIKGFMEDEGRQRTTKFISHRCVSVSDQLQMFDKEKERTKLLYSSEAQTSVKENTKTKKTQKAVGGGDGDAEEAGQTSGDRGVDSEGEGLNGDGCKARRKSAGKGKTARGKSSGKTKQAKPEIPIVQTTSAECDAPDCSNSTNGVTPDSVADPKAEGAQVETEEESNSSPESPLPQNDVSNRTDGTNGNNIVTVETFLPPKVTRPKGSLVGSKETFRLLRRKNLIVDAVRSLKVIEGYFPLQKIINDEEKQDGVSAKCCRKTIFRLVHNLSRGGLLKIYKTTVIQDGITKKVELIVHPSVQQNDEVVCRVMDQIRFKISSSYTAVRQAELRAKEQEDKAMKIKTEKKQFKTVKGLGKSLGFQPKMHRLRVIHNFIWYLTYGHPLKHDFAASQSTNETPANSNSSGPDAKQPGDHANQDLKDTHNSTASCETAAAGSMEKQTADSTLTKLYATSSSSDEEEEPKDNSRPDRSESDMRVYADEESWRRFVPPVRVHKDFGSGWAMVGDLLLCLPLSFFIQVIQINYKVDGLEEYLNDPIKQHYLVRELPARMKRQLLYKRKYIFAFHENLQKLVYMGLLQFGPVEKFKDKGQVFLFVRRHAAIVDTTNAEPHYWLVTESPDKPFERRQYTFNTMKDVENYWFDLMCVCLNTPLGVVRSKRYATEEERDPSFVHERNVFVGLAYLLKGNREACDDASIPGDGKGAGGLDSEFFGHLKRNWLWTNHLLAVKTTPSGLEATENKIRLKSLLNKSILRIALKTGITSARAMAGKRHLLTENVEVCVEPASRNQRVVGGKKRKRKRLKKDVVKVPRKKRKEPKPRTPSHDATDHQALKMMTRQRVYWSLQEDSLMMLCSVASHLLNRKRKKPFISYHVVRDLLHAEFEISMDKTSFAVGRRSRYILKNPQTLLNYRICLAEVYQDKPLMRVLEKKLPADLDNVQDWCKAYSEYISLLRHKFSSALNAGEMTMPDTKHELYARYKVSAIENRKRVSNKDVLKCREDIHTIVLQNLIQSTLAMNNSQMKSNRSFQTFHMYSRFNQELLCQIFIQCRSRGLVNRRRFSKQFGPKKNRALPILPMSFQLSQSYYRRFSWRFPHPLCTDSFRFLRSLINNGTQDDRPFTVFHQETESRSGSGEEVTEKRAGSEKKKKQNAGNGDARPGSELEQEQEKANGDSAKDGESEQREQGGREDLMEVSDQITEATSKTDEQKNTEDCSTTGSGSGLCEEPSSRELTGDDQPKEEPPEAGDISDATPGVSEEHPDVSEMMQFSMESPGGAGVVSLSLMSLGLVSVYLSIPKQMVVVDSTLVDNDAVKSMAALDEEDEEEDDTEECDGRKRMEVKSHQASHTNYLMMRGYCKPGIVKIRNLNSNDSIVVESCTMKMQLRNTPAHHVFSAEDSSPLDLTKCGPSLLPSILSHTIRSSSFSPSSVKECEGRLVEQRGYTPQDIQACAELSSSLDRAGENGLDIHELYQSHTHLDEPKAGRSRSLQQYMKELEEEGQVLQVGSLGARWVLKKHAEPWLLTLNPRQWSQSRFTSDRQQYLEHQHNIPFMRKRCRLDVQKDPGETPAKKSAVDRPGDAEGPSSVATPEKHTEEEEEQLETQNEGASGDNVLNSVEEGDKQMQPEEKGEKEAKREKKMATQEKKRELRPRGDRRVSERHEDACSAPTGPSSADHDESVSFISRPWRMVDGNLNRQVCKGVLESLLYHVMSKPGLTQQTLVEHYKATLQPMAVLDLVQALLDMGCLKKKTLVKGPKPSLFARPAHQTVSDTKVKIEEPDTVFYEPTISCVLRLSQVLPNERHWNYCV